MGCRQSVATAITFSGKLRRRRRRPDADAVHPESDVVATGEFAFGACLTLYLTLGCLIAWTANIPRGRGFSGLIHKMPTLVWLNLSSLPFKSIPQHTVVFQMLFANGILANRLMNLYTVI